MMINPSDSFWDTVEAQGWNDATVINVLAGFIDQQNAWTDLDEFATGVAKVENEWPLP